MPTKKKLTKRSIMAAGLPAAGKRFELRDGERRGLVLVVTAGGSRTWWLRKMVRGSAIKEKLGEFPAVGVDAAWEAALVVLAEIVSGERQASKPTLRSSPTVDEFFERWARDYAEIHRAKTVYHDRSLYKAHIKDRLGSVKLLAVTMADVQALHAAVGKAGKKRTANSCLQLLSTMFARAKEWGLYAADNPVEGIRRFKETKRERYLTHDELQALFKALLDRATDRDVRDIVLLALLTGARRGNIFAMAWDEIDIDGRLWTISATKTKTSEPYAIPLVDLAAAVLSDRRADSDSPWVFAADTATGHVYTVQKRWRDLVDRAGISDLKFHDLRHTSASWQVASGASLQVIGRTLGHRSSSTTARYAHVQMETARASLEAGAGAMLEAGAWLTALDKSRKVEAAED